MDWKDKIDEGALPTHQIKKITKLWNVDLRILSPERYLVSSVPKCITIFTQCGTTFSLPLCRTFGPNVTLAAHVVWPGLH